VKKCKEKNMGYIAMKALAGGLINNSAAAFAWMTQFDNVLPIWGIQRMTELEEFLGYFENPAEMKGELLETIEKDRAELAGDFCRGCGYCMPCPAGIEINTCARMSPLIRRSPSAQWLTEEKQAMMMKIEECKNCGKCKSKCPYGLDTPELLRRNLEDYKGILSGKVKI
jgi:predicted aldo/keto reductase-like oxidoreductase